MVAFSVLAGLLALAPPLMVLADVTPSEPGPGSVFRAGSTCRITWQGDTDSTTAWKDMAIELMSGSNFDMVHVTTVATDQDGTKDGSFQYTCPEVSPYSAIYFYQLTSRHTTTKTWTTRFTIESPDGSSTPPANAAQPSSGDRIPWGVGKLVDSRAVVPPPSNSTSSAASSSTPSFSSRSSPLPSNSRLIVTPSSSLYSSSVRPASSTPSAKDNTATSGALANAANDRRVWLAAAGTFVAVFL